MRMIMLMIPFQIQLYSKGASIVVMVVRTSTPKQNHKIRFIPNQNIERYKPDLFQVDTPGN